MATSGENYWPPTGRTSWPLTSPAMDHIARHDPARILREVAAKRALMASHDIGHDPCEAHGAMYESVPCDVILHLAAVYSSHPDYQQEWAL